MPDLTDQKKRENGDPYDISAVCRLTGLTAPALRMWEKRFNVVVPTRSNSGRRQYTKRDIQRLTLLKALAEYGHNIGSIFNLPLVELEKRLEESKNVSDGGTKASKENNSKKTAGCRIAVVGDHLGTLMDLEKAVPAGSAIFSLYSDLEEIENAPPGEEADLLIFEMPALFGEDCARLHRLITRFGALRAIVVYVYAQSYTVEQLKEEAGLITPIRAPISPDELRDAVATDIALANRSAATALEKAPLPRSTEEGVRERLFSERQLAIISKVSPTVDCECPHHLTRLLESLNGFETYSAQCENRNAADAEIHAYLYRMTAHARATIEDALKVLVEFENIDYNTD
ncbi:MerR family transcriptional regulator [Verrucomicrobiales bacterium]|nr:MerR family transcriptional regulator [Verrucomicrobiales bacterium]